MVLKIHLSQQKETDTLMEATAGEKKRVFFQRWAIFKRSTESPEYWPTILQFIQATE